MELETNKPLIKLDLGAGQNPREGFEGVDLNAPNPAHRVDLFSYPLPWADSSVDELHCSHFVEHLPATTTPDGRDYLLAFFDECWRILKPGGVMTVIVPNARSNRAFQDPTHRRFIVAESFLYLSADWRASQKLDHYRVSCNFSANVVPIIPTELSLLHPEAQARRFNESWNTILDWQATLTAVKITP